MFAERWKSFQSPRFDAHLMHESAWHGFMKLKMEQGERGNGGGEGR